MNHATFKASLFMAVGIIDHESGTRDMRRLDGLFRFMPITGTLAIVACAAMAGVPLLNGFLSKEMFFAETVFVSAHPAIEHGLPVAATLAGVFAVVYRCASATMFFGPPPTDCPRQPHEPVHWMRVPVGTGAGLRGRRHTAGLDHRTCACAGCAASGRRHATSVQPGGLARFNTPLVMSLIATAGGVLVYLRFADCFEAAPRARRPAAAGPGRQAAVREHPGLHVPSARRLVRWLGTRRLQPQLFAMLLIAGLAGLGSALIVPLDLGRPRPRPGHARVQLLWSSPAACAIGLPGRQFHRLAALAMLSVVGLALCITSRGSRRPDLALTQLAVEVVTSCCSAGAALDAPRRAGRSAHGAHAPGGIDAAT